MANVIVCIATSQVQAASLVSRLKTVAESNADISLLLPDRPALMPEILPERALGTKRRLLARGAGGLSGGLFGLLAGMGILTIPGAGLFIAAGPIIAALSGAALGAAMGGISGALVGMGVPEEQAQRYEARVKSGGALLSVRARHGDDIRRVRHVMEIAHAEDILIAG